MYFIWLADSIWHCIPAEPYCNHLSFQTAAQRRLWLICLHAANTQIGLLSARYAFHLSGGTCGGTPQAVSFPWTFQGWFHLPLPCYMSVLRTRRHSDMAQNVECQELIFKLFFIAAAPRPQCLSSWPAHLWSSSPTTKWDKCMRYRCHPCVCVWGALSALSTHFFIRRHKIYWY